MGKKLKNPDKNKRYTQNGKIFIYDKTINKISISKRKQKRYNSRKSLKLNSKAFIPKKYRLLDSSNSGSTDYKKDVPEWMNPETQNILKADIRFNHEIIDYVNYIIPHDLSLTKRYNTIEILTNILKKYDPNLKLVLYGSFSQNTSTIFSDLDFTIYNNNYSNFFYNNYSYQYELLNLMNFLIDQNFSQDIIFIDSIIPILRGTCESTGIKVDISFNSQNGYKAAEIIRNIVDKNIIIK